MSTYRLLQALKRASAGPGGGAAPNPFGAPNPVQIKLQQQQAAAMGDGTPVGNPEVMKAQESAMQAQQQGQQAAMQAQQQAAQAVAAEQQKAQQTAMQSQEAAMKLQAEAEKAKLEAETERAKAELSATEAETKVRAAEAEAKASKAEAAAKAGINDTMAGGSIRSQRYQKRIQSAISKLGAVGDIDRYSPAAGQRLQQTLHLHTGPGGPVNATPTHRPGGWLGTLYDFAQPAATAQIDYGAHFRRPGGGQMPTGPGGPVFNPQDPTGSLMALLNSQPGQTPMIGSLLGGMR